MKKTPILFLTLLLVLLYSLGVSYGLDTPDYLFQFGNTGQLNKPHGIDVAPNGNIYVVDSGNWRVSVFNSSGNYLFSFGELGGAPGQFSAPSGVAIAPNGNAYVTDGSDYDVSVWDSNGNYLFEFGSIGTGDGEFRTARGIAIDANGRIFVGDDVNENVQVFDLNGNFLFKFGNYLRFSGARGIDFDSHGNVYVVDGSLSQIKVFDPNGNFLYEFGSYGSAPGQLWIPTDITIDDDDNVFIADFRNDRIQVFDTAGNFILGFGSRGTGNGQFDGPHDLHFDSATSRLYVTDSVLHRVQVFELASSASPPVAVDDSAITDEDVAVSVNVAANDSDPDGNLDINSITLINYPTNGSVSNDGNGLLTYTPTANYNGADSFSYQICDTDGLCDSAIVAISINPVNDTPIAHDDTVWLDEDTTASINLSASDVDDDSLNYTLLSQPTRGTLSGIAPNLVYTPDSNFFGNDSLTFQVNDGLLHSNIATINITVNSVNDAPICDSVLPSRDYLWPPEHQMLDVNIQGVTDIEGDAITITITSIFQDEPTNSTGDGDVAPDGNGIGTETAFIRSERDGNGNGRVYHIGFTATDNLGASCSAEVSIGALHDQGPKGYAVDDGALYDSTTP